MPTSSIHFLRLRHLPVGVAVAGAVSAAVLAGCRHAADDSRPLELAAADGVMLQPRAAQPPAGYDPLALARRSIGHLTNAEANIPSLCYARTDGRSNPCAACHTHSIYPNLADDWELQQNDSFSAYAKTNHWKNLFRDRTALVARFSDDDVLLYVRGDNYTPLRAWLAARPELPVWRPDLDFARGFDAAGFASDGSGWRAWRPQDARGIPDAPQVGHTEPEYAEYLARVGGGDELRANDEVRARFFPDGDLDRGRLEAARADIAPLVLPSRQRAIALDRAYLANVIEQSYVWGRDAIITPAKNVHATIIERSTGLGEHDRTYRDGSLRLDWNASDGRMAAAGR